MNHSCNAVTPQPSRLSLISYMEERRVAILIPFPLRLSEDDLERIKSRRHEMRSQSLYSFETGVIING